MKLKKFMKIVLPLAAITIMCWGALSAEAAYYTAPSEDNDYTATWDLTQYTADADHPDNTIDVGSYHAPKSFTGGKGAEWNGIWVSSQYRRCITYKPETDGTLTVIPMYGDVSITTTFNGDPDIDLTTLKKDMGNMIYSSLEVKAGTTYYIKSGLKQGNWWGVAQVSFKEKAASVPIEAERVEVEPDEGQTADAAGFVYTGALEENQVIKNIIWTVTDTATDETATVTANTIPTITGEEGFEFKIGLLITDIPSDKTGDLSASVTIE